MKIGIISSVNAVTAIQIIEEGRYQVYLIDFFKRISRKSNIPVLIYLVINVFVIAGIIQLLFKNPFWQAFLFGIGLYLISISIALSPIGEWILRLQTGCKKIKRPDQINRIEPLFREVYSKAMQLDASIPNNVQLYINTDLAPNAFATGRKTICMTEGLLNMPDDQIKATLGHEFGHLAHKDTDLILVVSVGNLIITTIVTGIRIVINIVQFFLGILCIFLGGSEGALASITNSLCNMLINIFVMALMWVWTKIGILLVMKSSRDTEYEADQFSFNLGYGNELCILLDSICGDGAKGLFANLASSHPDKNDRIAKLQQMGATYSRLYA